MEIIRFKKAGGSVQFRLEVTGPVVYRYYYVADGKEFRGSDTSPEPHLHSLGMPVELELDSNRWSIRMGNPTDSDLDYEVTIVWEQDGERLHPWHQSGVISDSSPAKEEADTALLASED